MIQKMLAEQGHYYSVQQITEEFYVLREQLRELVRIEDENPDIGKYETLRVSNLEAVESKYEADFVDYYHFLRIKVLHNPLFIICKEYLKITSIAYQNDLLSSVSLGKGTRCICDLAEDDHSLQESKAAVKIAQYTSDKLGNIFTGGTLKECVMLTQSDEANAYREKVDEFINSLAKLDYNNMKIVDKEIEKAINAMRWKKALAVTGTVITTAGFVSTLAAPFTGIPYMPEISFAATVLGFPLNFYDPSKKYLWASYGMVHKK